MPNTTIFHRSPNQVAIVCVNLGTPSSPTPQAVGRYLREFLSDKRVVELPRLLWWFILNAVIVPFRGRKSAQNYQKIWTEAGSPLAVYTHRQVKRLGEQLHDWGYDIKVVEAMRYGRPHFLSALKTLQAEGYQRILVVPLYPQYSATTTASVMDVVFDYAHTQRNIAEYRFIKHFHDHPLYIDALAASVAHYWQLYQRGQHLVISFHGIPERHFLMGDPYYCECQKTARLLAQKLNLREGEYSVTFQSRLGRAKWLSPYTQSTIETLAKKGLKRVDVICPGFVCDCLETLEEINIGLRQDFVRSGGESFHYIPCLNTDADWIKGLANIVLSYIKDWPITKEAVQLLDAESQLRQTRVKQPGKTS